MAPGWTWRLEVTGGSKDEVADAQGQCSPTETVDAGWVITREIGELGDDWRSVGLCERPGTC